MEYIRIQIGNTNQIPLGTGRRIMIGIHEVLIFRTVDDRLFAFGNFCQHHGNTLVEGPLEECKLECPLYGHTFNFETGHWSSEGDNRCSQAFKVWEENGKILILYHFPVLNEVAQPLNSKRELQETLHGKN